MTIVKSLQNIKSTEKNKIFTKQGATEHPGGDELKNASVHDKLLL